MTTKTKKGESSPIISVKATPETTDHLETITKHYHVNRSEAVRMAIKALHDSIGAKGLDRSSVGFSGDESTVAAKWRLIEAVEQGMGSSMAAYEAGVTEATADEWAEEDPVFTEFVQNALNRSVEAAEHRLRSVGMMDGNPKALVAWLAAKSPDFHPYAATKRAERYMIGQAETLGAVLHKHLTPQAVSVIMEDLRRALQGSLMLEDPPQQPPLPAAPED